MTINRCFSVFVAMLLMCGQLSAKGGSYHTADHYNRQHIDSLPSEVRNFILHRCGAPKALHTFASYFDNLKQIVLHFERFVCDGDGTYCNTSGCLHQVWVSVSGHYRLVRSYYARPENERP